jgi:pRiA4b ORF-3-like protein
VRERAHVYQFKLLLMEITPAIWRNIQVPESYSFWDLHVALQDSMGWLDYHLHLFRLREPITGEVVQIGIPDDDAFEGDEPILPSWGIPIANYFSRPGVVARYDYDFGDGWEHELTLEAILSRQRGKKYPLCLDGARACPPEDCGGVGGYENLLTVIQTPAHEEYESTLQWLGGRFDPEKFDPQRVKFDDPARRYELAFEEPFRRSHRGRRATRPDNTRLRRSRAARARR